MRRQASGFLKRPAGYPPEARARGEANWGCESGERTATLAFAGPTPSMLVRGALSPRQLRSRSFSSSGARPPLKLLYVPSGGSERLAIWDQLRIEEGLLKARKENWCILNASQQSQPAIVLGISGKLQELVEVEEAERQRVLLIKRFTGGGTVFVDEGTRFISLVLNQSAMPQVECFPRPIMAWTGEFYDPVFKDLRPSDPLENGAPEGFHVRDNDYCIGDRKFGGNAQAITRQRWLHHTSFLWDTDLERMHSLLKMPSKVPAYREGREHRDFVRPLSAYLEDPRADSAPLMEEAVLKRLHELFEVQHASLSEALLATELECHRCNQVLDYR